MAVSQVPIGPYTKNARSKAKIGEVRALARAAAYPSVLVARFALLFSTIAIVLSALALYVVLVKR